MIDDQSRKVLSVQKSFSKMNLCVCVVQGDLQIFNFVHKKDSPHTAWSLISALHDSLLAHVIRPSIFMAFTHAVKQQICDLKKIVCVCVYNKNKYLLIKKNTNPRIMRRLLWPEQKFLLMWLTFYLIKSFAAVLLDVTHLEERNLSIIERKKI